MRQGGPTWLEVLLTRVQRGKSGKAVERRESTDIQPNTFLKMSRWNPKKFLKFSEVLEWDKGRNNFWEFEVFEK